MLFERRFRVSVVADLRLPICFLVYGCVRAPEAAPTSSLKYNTSSAVHEKRAPEATFTKKVAFVL